MNKLTHLVNEKEINEMNNKLQNCLRKKNKNNEN